MDSSTSRLELTLRPATAAEELPFRRLRLRAHDVELPLRFEHDERGPVLVFGVRYRSFAPNPGFHPKLGVQDPLKLVLVDPDQPEALEITVHEWRPDGMHYADLPADAAEARARRTARCTMRRVPKSGLAPVLVPPRAALDDYALDLRYLPTVSAPPERPITPRVGTKGVQRALGLT